MYLFPIHDCFWQNIYIYLLKWIDSFYSIHDDCAYRALATEAQRTINIRICFFASSVSLSLNCCHCAHAIIFRCKLVSPLVPSLLFTFRRAKRRKKICTHYLIINWLLVVVVVPACISFFFSSIPIIDDILSHVFYCISSQRMQNKYREKKRAISKWMSECICNQWI